MPLAWRGRLRPLPGPVLLTAIAFVRGRMRPLRGPVLLAAIASVRGRLRPLTGPVLLAAIASVASAAGVTLGLVAADLSLPAGIPLWDAAFVVSVLAVIGSVMRFPQWWASPGGPSASRRACAGARQRRASHAVEIRRGRASRSRPRPNRVGVHLAGRPVTGNPIDSVTRRSDAAWLLASRRRDAMPRLQRQHGRSRG